MCHTETEAGKTLQTKKANALFCCLVAAAAPPHPHKERREVGLVYFVVFYFPSHFNEYFSEGVVRFILDKNQASFST
jgi:hypothetical protein